MKELGIDLGLLVSQVVNFGLLVALLTVFLYKPILRKLEERAERVKKGLEDADRAERLKAEAEAHRKEELDHARGEAHEVVERATRAAEQQRQEILAQARQEAHEIIMRAQQQAEREIQEGQVAIRQEVIDLAIASASHLLQEDVDDEKHHQLVKEFLAEADHLE